MEDASGFRWYSSVDQISQCIVRVRGPAGFTTPLERSLLTFHKMCVGLRALNLDENTYLADAEWQSVPFRPSGDSARQLESRDYEWAVFDELIGIICVIASLNAK
jgi:hypothetical protein